MVKPLLLVKATGGIELNWSGLPNLPTSQRAAVRAAAIAANPNNPQNVLNAIATTQWLDFFPVSDNLLTSLGSNAAIGEAVASIRSITSNFTYSLLTGAGGTKTALGMSALDTSYYEAMLNQNNIMTLIVNCRIDLTDTGQYILDFNLVSNPNRRIFEASAPGVLNPGFFDGTAHREFTAVTNDELFHLDTYLLNGASLSLRRDQVDRQTITVAASPAVGNTEVRLFGTATERFNGEIRGLFYAPTTIDYLLIEAFANAYYN